MTNKNNKSLTKSIIKKTSNNFDRVKSGIGSVKDFTKDQTKKFIWRKVKLFLLANIAIVIPVAIILTIVFVALVSSSTFLVAYYAKYKIDTAYASVKEETSEIILTYSEYLKNRQAKGAVEYTDDGISINPDAVVDNANGGGIDNVFGDTQNSADKIEGSSLLHQVYNAMIESQNASDIPGFNAQLMYGINITEVCCSPIKWAPYVAVGTDYNTGGTYDIKKYGLEDILKAKLKGTLDLVAFKANYGVPDSFNNPFQMETVYYTNSYGNPRSTWTDAQWRQFVNGSKAEYDGTDDGVSDIFNYVDNLSLLRKYYNVRYYWYHKIYLNSETDKDDMYIMFHATRHVGLQNRKRDRNDNCQFAGKDRNPEQKTWCYPYDESLNPHVALMRAAINEYKNNGPHYTRYKQLMQGQSRTNSNGETTQPIIKDFYKANGWTEVNGGFEKKFTDGNGTVRIQGGGGQDIYYAFRVYWGAKIGFPEFQKLLE